MTFSIPAVDQLGWGEPLQNHLAQLNDPEMGGFNVVQNDAERDSKFWPNGDSTKNEYLNKTIYNRQTGGFQIWEVTLPNGPYIWKDLQREIGNSILPGVGQIYGSYDLDTRQPVIKGINGADFIALGITTGYSIKVNTPYHPNVFIDVYEPLNSTTVIGRFYKEETAFSYTVGITSGSGVATINGAPSLLTNDILKPGDYIHRPGSFGYTVEEILSATTFRINTVAFATGTIVPNFIRKVVRENEAIEYLVGIPLVSYFDENSENKLNITYGGTLQAQNVAITTTENQSGVLYSDQVDLVSGVTNYNRNIFIGRYGVLTGQSYDTILYANTLQGIRNYDSVTPENYNGSVAALVGLQLNAGHSSGPSPYPSSMHTSAIFNLRVYPQMWYGTADDMYGIYLFDSQPNSAVMGNDRITRMWGMVQMGAQTSNRNWFNANTGIGTFNTTLHNVAHPLIDEKLVVFGNIRATGTITPGSDERWKEDITVIESPLELLSKLKGVNYKWNKEQQEFKDSDIHIGLIAQDAVDIPGAVKADKEGYLHLDYMGLVGLLVETNKELLKKVEVLEERIAILESK